MWLLVSSLYPNRQQLISLKNGPLLQKQSRLFSPQGALVLILKVSPNSLAKTLKFVPIFWIIEYPFWQIENSFATKDLVKKSWGFWSPISTYGSFHVCLPPRVWCYVSRVSRSLMTPKSIDSICLILMVPLGISPFRTHTGAQNWSTNETSLTWTLHQKFQR